MDLGLGSRLAGLNPFGGGGVVAIDFGTQALKLLQVSAVEPLHLVAAACVQTPAELLADAPRRFEFQCGQLAQVVRAGGFKARRGVCAIPSSQMLCKHMQVQPAHGQSVQDATLRAAAEQLGCEPSMLGCRGVVVEGAVCPAGKQEVIALATAQSLVDRLMQALRQCRLEPVGLQSEFQALLSSFRPVNRRASDADITSLYIDIGAGGTKIVIGHGTKLAFAKGVAIGGRFFDQVVAQQIGCEHAQAHALWQGMPSLTRLDATAPASAMITPTLSAPGAGVAVAVRPATDAASAAHRLAARAAGMAGRIDLTEPLRALTDEIALCVRYYEQLFPSRRIDRLIFVGGESRHTGLCQHIARQFKFPAHAGDPLARLARTGSEPCAGVDLAQPQPGWAVPLGLLMSPTDL